MYECENCHESSDKSSYHIPVVVDSDKGKKIIHVECCSKEELVKILERKIESDTMVYNDALKLVQNLNKENIKKFEDRYGTYHETTDGIQIDRFSEILAIVSQLKKHLKN
jgi:transposase-like protein